MQYRLTRMRTFNDGRGVDDVAEAQSTDEMLIEFCQRHSRHVVHH